MTRITSNKKIVLELIEIILIDNQKLREDKLVDWLYLWEDKLPKGEY